MILPTDHLITNKSHLKHAITDNSQYSEQSNFENDTEIQQVGKITTSYRRAKWSVVCRPKDQGGLGIHDLEVKNRAYLANGCLSY